MEEVNSVAKVKHGWNKDTEGIWGIPSRQYLSPVLLALASQFSYSTASHCVIAVQLWSELNLYLLLPTLF